MQTVQPKTHNVIELTDEDIFYLETELNLSIEVNEFEYIDFIPKAQAEYYKPYYEGEEPSDETWAEWERISENAPLEAIKLLGKRFGIDFPEHTEFCTCVKFNIIIIY